MYTIYIGVLNKLCYPILSQFVDLTEHNNNLKAIKVNTAMSCITITYHYNYITIK